MYLKRLWDTTEKKIVYAKGPTGHDCQVWTDKDGINLYIYDMAQWLEYTPSVENDGKVYGPTWKAINGDDVVGYYETNEPTDLYSWESGDEASYVFKDYDGTVLKSGKVDEGTAPTPPENPTRTGYTFTGWNPTVGPITKRTVYTATYELNTYTVTVQSNNTDYGTVDVASVTANYGATITVSDNEITIGNTTVTATAASGYVFISWTCNGGSVPATITEAITIVANFGVLLPNEASYSFDDTTENGVTTLFSYSDSATDRLDVAIVTDQETGDTFVEVTGYGIFQTGATAGADALIDFFGAEDAEAIRGCLFIDTQVTATYSLSIDSTFLSAMQDVYNNPTQANITALETLWYSHTSAEPIVPVVTPIYTVTIQSNNTSYGTVDESSLTVLEGTALSSLSNVLTVGTTDVTATAETGYEFVSWTCSGSTIPATVTEDITIVANFQASTPTPTEGYRYVRWNITANSGATSGTQVSEFNLTDGTNAMARPAGTTVTCDKSTRLDGAAQNLIDGDTDTKFGSDTGTPYAITFDLGSGNTVDPTVYDNYNWYQANDAETETLRNPASWNVQFSEDGVNWETWSTVTGETIIDENSALAGTWTLTAPL